MADQHPVPENKTEAEVLIGGRVYTLTGYESEEYLQRIASYLNGKLAELEAQEGFKRLPPDIQTVLLETNIADDYFKMQEKNERMKEEAVGREKDIYDLKHELIATQIRLENAEGERAKLSQEKEEASRRAFELQTRLEHAEKAEPQRSYPTQTAQQPSQGQGGLNGGRRY